jgi:hypothetical protein
VFGIIRPCEHRLGGELRAAWQAHLCGLCLALRDDHGQAARVATNYDGLLVSVLTEAQMSGPPGRRRAGPCPLRGMRRLGVATGECARLAAGVSLVLAAAKVRDHVLDGDGLAGRPGVRVVARQVAGRWTRQGAATGQRVGFDTGVLLDAVGRQARLEATAGPGSSLLAVTEPTETATGAAFGHTAVLAGRPGNREPLTEVGRLFGRVAHLLDAVEDLAADDASGAWNPVRATGTGVDEAHRLCRDAVLGIRLALADVDFADGRLAIRLLTRELEHALHRTFRPLGLPVPTDSGPVGPGGPPPMGPGGPVPMGPGGPPPMEVAGAPYGALPPEAPQQLPGAPRGCFRRCGDGCCDGCDCGDCCEACSCCEACDCGC